MIYGIIGLTVAIFILGLIIIKQNLVLYDYATEINRLVKMNLDYAEYNEELFKDITKLNKEISKKC